ncbi:MAG: ligand-binding protein SH3 [Spirochaetales bacterium]|nr:MAG: ligand-binding protein SH3 [Spirochaetales bacterium]
MSINPIIATIFLAFLPISELRGAIPYGVARGLTLWQAASIAVVCNILVAPVAFIFLETFHKILYRWGVYARLFDRFVERSRLKIHEKVERYGYLGIMLFVAVPLPITGAWTGTLGAWILGLDKRRTMLAVAAGVLVSGIIVSLVVGLGIEAFSFFVKRF